MASRPSIGGGSGFFSRMRRVLVLATIAAAVVAVGAVLFSNTGSYTVRAQFVNAGQIVHGDPVKVGGTSVGSVKDISLTPNGQALLTLDVQKPYIPLRVGTTADIRQASLSGIANRYVELRIPPGTSQAQIPNNGLIGSEETQTQVDLDEVFNSLDPPTRAAVQDFLTGSARELSGVTDQQRAAFEYLNPNLYTSSEVFNQIGGDTPELTRFLLDSSRFVTDIAQRKDDLAGLITNLDNTMRALGNQRLAVADTLRQLPPFLRAADTTFVNLRNTLDVVDPLVNASKPVAIKLVPFFAQLRPFARDARPTVHDLAQIVLQPGPNNDLVDLNRTLPPLAHVALDTQNINGADRAGSFPETAKALNQSAPIVAQGRPYTPDLVGWFNDFSHTGVYDALGGISRQQLYFNVASTGSNGVQGAPLIGNNLSQRGSSQQANTKNSQLRRCPGAAEAPAPDQSNVWSPSEQQALDCLEQDRATAPR